MWSAICKDIDVLDTKSLDRICIHIIDSSHRHTICVCMIMARVKRLNWQIFFSVGRSILIVCRELVILDFVDTSLAKLYPGF